MGDRPAPESFPGTLRDVFAGLAMQEFLRTHMPLDLDVDSGLANDIGLAAYQIAEGMLRARQVVGG